MKKRIMALCFAVVMLASLVATCIPITAATANGGTLHAYPEFDSRIERDYMYSVSLTHEGGTTALPVYNHVEDSRTTRNPYDTVADAYRRFSSFAFDNSTGSVTVNIKVNCDFESYSVIPSAKNFPSTFDAATGTIKVTLEKPDYFMIRLNGKNSTNIAILADAPETDIPTAGANTIIYDRPWTDEDGSVDGAADGVLNITTPNTTVYIAPGCVLNSRIKITADGCKVVGRGAMVDPYGNIRDYNEADVPNDEYTVLFVKNCNNTVIDGIHILNSRAYNLEIQGDYGGTYAENTTVTNLKIMSTQMSSDGMMFNYYINDAKAEHCFVYCGDNALNYEDNASFKDILVGTTCNAIFPQTDVTGSSLEDIYVFRADDNLINFEYGGSGGQTKIDDTMTNIYAQDLVYTNFFMFLEHEFSGDTTVVSLNGGTRIKNICLPAFEYFKKNSIFHSGNSGGTHTISIENMYVDGAAATKNGNSLSAGGQSRGLYMLGSHTFTVTSGSGNASFNSAAKTAHSVTVNYKNVNKNVFVGDYQVYLKNPAIEESGIVYLPYEEIKSHLGARESTNTVTKNGIAYIAHNTLMADGMASAVSVSGNALLITPYNFGENLLIPEDGGLSRFTEYRASHQYLTLNSAGTTYKVTDKAHDDREGMYRTIDEEIKKYGAGEYTLTFDVRSNSANKTLACGIDYGTELNSQNNCKLAYVDHTLTTSWKSVTVKFTVTDALLEENNLAIVIYDREKKLDDFSVRRIKLTKDSGAELYGMQLRSTDNAVRFVGLVKDHEAQGMNELGFSVKVGEMTKELKVTKVYDSLVASGGNITPYASGAKFFTFCLTDVPNNTVFEISTYAVVNGQKVVYGNPAKYTFTGSGIVPTT